MTFKQWGHSLFYNPRSLKKKIPELPDSEVQQYQSSGSVFPAFSWLFLYSDKITAVVPSTTSPSQENTEGRKPEGLPTFPLFLSVYNQGGKSFPGVPRLFLNAIGQTLLYAHLDQSLDGGRDCHVWFKQSQFIFRTWGLDCLSVVCLKLTFNWMSYLFIC